MTRLVTTLTSLSLEPSLAKKLNRFSELFQKWNKSINLSAARAPLEVEEQIVDSLHVIPHLTGAAKVLDVGAGGGFPVVIAALCLPNTNFTALEPVHKKHAFLRTAARELVLVNLEAFATRVDDHTVRDYDVAMSRATFDLRDWLTMGLELVRPGGVVLGFEAVAREDLPTGTERHVYQLDGKTRAIVSLRRPAS